ncbi:CHAP domain-containing protein [Novosphingobium fuchskuhlense]|uniref:CHAP domain-containing protein n=1 Tax=Novosphingobium fuchskuhlense TaxID=1117702 RepID=UPI0009EAC25B|nr:CHAP domain-containing protein [Novosphingobium fuchskuhlense]
MSSLALRLVVTGLLAALSVPAAARPLAPVPAAQTSDDADAEAPLPYIQCVPYAREVSGIQLFGDAHTWWDQAAGRYARGTQPRVGAVMAFRPHGAMVLGHVAAVSRIIDSRTVLLRHANWSPIDGRRGHLEDNVRAVDVSPANDWSEVRVWYAPLGGLGTTHWPVEGFIYNRKPPKALGPNERLTVPASAPASAPKAGYTSRIGPDFLKGIVPETSVAPARRMVAAQRSLRNDPIGRIIASRLN